MAIYIKVQKKQNYLAHHGVLGQKWGVRNGPPYPLKPGDHSASEKKAGWTKSVSGNAIKKKTGKVGSIKSSEEKQSYRDNKNLYKSLAEAKKDELKSQRQHPVIKSILSDARYKENEEKFRNTPYDGPAEEYDPSLDPEVVEKSIKQFKEEMGRDYNDDDYQDYKILSYIKEDICDSEGYNEKANKINAAPNWDKAYDEYMATKSKIISDHLSGYDDKKVAIRGDSYLNTYKRAVTEILYDIEREEWWKSHEQKLKES